MNIGLFTPIRYKNILKLWLLTCSCLFLTQLAIAQIITVPSGNDPDTSTRKPFGCFYGYERTHSLYTATEMNNTTGYITKVGFFLNSVLNPAESTPVVIKLKTTTNGSITSSIYGASSGSATTVYSGNITSDMLSANNWVTVILNTPFNYTGNNLEVFVETNYGETGGEDYNAKEFRHSPTLSYRCEFWEQDQDPPTDYGVLTHKRPNIQLTFEAACTGTPVPGNTLSSSDTVCANQPFVLSLENIVTTPGIIYQWQYSSNGSSWFDIPTGTSSELTYTQSASTYYQCIVTCTSVGGGTATSTPIHVFQNPFYHCYCASFATDDADTKIDTVSLGTINAGSDPSACETYTDNTSMSTTLNPGQPNTIHIVNGSCSGDPYPSYVVVYIDYNHNAVFDSSELVYLYGPTAYLNSIPDGVFTVPFTAFPGLTGMRVVLKEGDAIDAIPTPCGDYTFGETEDYLVNITSPVACSGTPVAGTTLSSEPSVCANQPFTLSLSSYPNNSGIEYQWQYLNVTVWTNIAGATSTTYTVASQSAATQYRCNVTCTNLGGGTSSSTPVLVNMSPFYACYCASYPVHAEDTKIDSVMIGSIVAGTPENWCETYTNNTNLSTDLALNDQATIHIRNGSCTGEFDSAWVAVYIDYNADHDFNDPNERVYSFGPTTGINTIPNGTFTIPPGATLGLTGLRIVLSETDSIPSPCGTYDWGETEDYAVNIVSLPACTVPPEAGSATASVVSACSPQNVTLGLVGNSTGLGLTYQWQSSPDNSNWSDIPNATSSTYTTLTSSTNYYRCKVTCSGNTDISVSVLVTINASPVGNLITDPIIIAATPYTHNGDNFQSNCWTSDYTGLAAQLSPDVFYSMSFDTTGLLEISTCDGTSFNTYLHLLDENGNHIDSNDNFGVLCPSSTFASMTYHVDIQPSSLYIVVEGHNTDTGLYQLNVNFTPDTFTQVNSVHPLSSQLFLYPNPATSDFTIQLNTSTGTNGPAQVKLINTIGQVAEEQTMQIVHGKLSGEMHVNGTLPDGMYLVEINSGVQQWNQRIVIQH